MLFVILYSSSDLVINLNFAEQVGRDFTLITIYNMPKRDYYVKISLEVVEESNIKYMGNVGSF